MVGIFIEDKKTKEQFVLTRGNNNSYPDIKKVTITLESLKVQISQLFFHLFHF